METGFGLAIWWEIPQTGLLKIKANKQAIGSGILLAVNTGILKEHEKQKFLKIVFFSSTEKGNHQSQMKCKPKQLMPSGS